MLERLTAVILSWGSPELALRSAHALLGDGLPPDRLVVADNASTAASESLLREELPDSLVLPFAANLGFARANNQAARELPGGAYLFVNNDAFLHRPGSLGGLVEPLDDPGVGIVLPRVLDPDLTLQPTVAAIQSPGVALVRASGVSRLVPNRWQPSWSTHWDHSRARAVQAAMGPVVLVRSSTWGELGGFVESAFMYAEDLDLCWRARSAGWTVWFTPEAEFVHVGNASGAVAWGSEARRAENVGRAEAAMIRRHLGPVRARAALGFLVSGLLLRAAAYTAAGRPRESGVLRAAARGYLTRSDEAG